MKTTTKKVPAETETLPNESTGIIAQDQQIVTAEFSTEALIARAIDQKVPVETMERLLAMAKEMQAIKAKQEFDKAMAKFQSECPTIVKTKEVHTKSGAVAYKYAPIESIVEQVKPYLQSNGFSYSTNMEVLPAGVKVTCKITHIAGHSENSEMEVPLGERTQIMSASQVTAAASTFAKRYAFCNAFGILTGDEDNDARPMNEEIDTPIAGQPTAPKKQPFPPTQKQLNTIKENMEKKGLTEEDVYNEGYDLKNLTGGFDGTASELITWLFNFKSYGHPTGLNGLTKDDKYMDMFVKDLEACQSAIEYEKISKEIKAARESGKISEPSYQGLVKVAKNIIVNLK